MSKRNNLAVTEAARDAAQALSPFHVAARRIVDRQCSEEISGNFVGVHIVDGRITDIVARNGTVRIEE